MKKYEGFLDEFQKTGGAATVVKALGLAGLGAAGGAGGMYIHGEKKRKKQLNELANLFRQANQAENRLIAQRAFQAGRQS